MDPRVGLIRDFSRTFAEGTAKVETKDCGFPFLDRLLRGGVELEYGELTPLRLLHRYKLVHVSEARMIELLAAHVDKEWNVCRYFGPTANDVFCFNVDNNRKATSAAVVAEVEVTVRALEGYLREVECEPLVVASGRGYHVWCRLGAPVENARLYEFLLPMAARALATVTAFDHTHIKINLYPDVRLRNVVSLRLFGSLHAKTGVFSRVLGPDGLLDEAASWDRFADFVEKRAISTATFDAAYGSLASLRLLIERR
ncbi:MAG TPA: hypothetical protein VGM06_18235 [Polyangiaceae bacterium]|jgi:hypothetical protein